MTKKPAAGEDDFFAKEDALRVEKLRKKLDGERAQREAENLKKAHWMRCPKCGNEMKEVAYRQVMVDQCGKCGYVGFDAGELEIVAGANQGFLRSVLGALTKK
ncbi:MAG: zf-TFIIB domain-containing protein [Bdellovibrionota bacterium]